MKARALLSLAVFSALPLAAQEAAPPPAAPEAPAPAAPVAAVSPELMEAAKDMLAFTEELHAIASSDAPAADKMDALQVLKPRAAELSKVIDRIGTPALRRALHVVQTDEDRERRAAAAMADVDSNPELYDAFEEISALLAGRIATETPPAEVAEAFLATLREGAALVQDESLSAQDRLDGLENLARRLSRFYPWVVRGGDSDAVAAILLGTGEMKELVAQHDALARWAVSPEDAALATAASFYRSTLSEIMYVFGEQHPQEAGPVELDGPLDGTEAPEMVAAAFLTALQKGVALAEDTTLTRELRLRELAHQARQLQWFEAWASAEQDTAAIAARLAANEDTEGLLGRLEALADWAGAEDNEELAQRASLYVGTLDKLLYHFYDQYMEEIGLPEGE